MREPSTGLQVPEGLRRELVDPTLRQRAIARDRCLLLWGRVAAAFGLLVFVAGEVIDYRRGAFSGRVGLLAVLLIVLTLVVDAWGRLRLLYAFEVLDARRSDRESTASE